jgi:hypothetical protein
MIDFDQAIKALRLLIQHPNFKTALGVVEDVVYRNQNPGCGGDGLMSPEAWRDLQISMRALQNLRRALFIEEYDGATLAAQYEGYIRVAEKTKVVSAESEDRYVYVLLSNGKFLRSPAMDDHLCARQHAQQVMSLQLSPGFLTECLLWEELDEV